jgi:hypothetical protein
MHILHDYMIQFSHVCAFIFIYIMRTHIRSHTTHKIKIKLKRLKKLKYKNLFSSIVLLII